MEFTDEPLEPFGRKFLAMGVPSDPALKLPAVFRVVRELKARGYLPAGADRMAELCFDEAIVNAMQHGNRLDPNKKVRVTLFGDEQRWGAIVEDEGEGFGPEALRPPEGAGGAMRETGRGIPLMDAYVDRLRYSRKGNKLFMTRRRQTQPDETPASPAGAPSALPVAEPLAPRAGATAEELALEISDEAELMGMVEVERDGGAVVASIRSQRVDESSRDEVDASLSRAAEGAALLVVDMSEVEYISSVGLGVLITAHKRMAAQGGRLVLAGLRPQTQKIFTAVGLQRILAMAPDRAAALAGRG